MPSLIALTFVLAAATQPAAAAGPSLPAASPISIASCNVSQPGTLGNAKFGFRPAYIDGVTVVYTNQRDIAATEIRFSIEYAGVSRTVVDRNSIAGGKRRTREFTIGSVIYTSDSAVCRLNGVTFADGTSYSPPAP